MSKIVSIKTFRLHILIESPIPFTVLCFLTTIIVHDT